MSSGQRNVADKLLHIEAALDGGSEVSGGRASALRFEDLRFRPTALPEVNLQEIDLGLTFLQKRIRAPLMISPMTGGVERGGALNRRMAWAAEHFKIPFGVGSQRVALEVESRRKDFQVREVAPSIPLFANLGAIQLVKGYGPEHALRAVEMVGADAIFLHLNAMQEVVQEGGDTEWRGVLAGIERVCDALSRGGQVPVFAREVGFGLTAEDARRLADAGVAGLDCAGGGGTSWTLLEGRVARTEAHRALGETFAAWGLTTPEAILEVRSVAPTMPLIASGGVRSGLDVARSVALGATVAGMASPVLRAAVEGEEALVAFLQRTIAEVRATFFGVGAASIEEFRARCRWVRPLG